MAQAVALNRVSQDDRRAIIGIQRTTISSVDLAVIVAATTQVPNLLVGHILDQLGSARIALEEVVADVAAVVGLERLEVAVWSGVH